jgi:hypothetical protein
MLMIYQLYELHDEINSDQSELDISMMNTRSSILEDNTSEIDASITQLLNENEVSDILKSERVICEQESQISSEFQILLSVSTLIAES